jgi:hypothetical protein
MEYVRFAVKFASFALVAADVPAAASGPSGKFTDQSKLSCGKRTMWTGKQRGRG